MKKWLSLLLVVPLLVVPLHGAWAADSLIRIDCTAGSSGAKVFLNGIYQFDCTDSLKKPISTDAGNYVVRAVKTISSSQEKVFEERVELTADAPQRVRIQMPEQATSRTAAAASDADAKATRSLQDELQAAETGDLKAMQSLVDRYRTGRGVAKSEERAKHWQDRLTRQRKIDELEESRMEMLGLTMTMAEGLYGDDEPNIFWITSAGLTMFPTMMIDMVSSPFTSTQNSIVDSEIEALRLETHAVRWANPDALMARAMHTLW